MERNFFSPFMSVATFFMVLSFISSGAFAADEVSPDAFTVMATDAIDEITINAVLEQIMAVPDFIDSDELQTVIVSSNSDLNRMIDEGKADLVISDARVVVRTATRAPTARTLRIESTEPQTAAVVFAVSAQSPIHSLSDLKGRTLAFEGVWNRSGYYAPMSLLLKEGQAMNYLETVRQDPVSDAVNFVFAGDEVNMVAWLNRGLVDAIAFNITDWENEDETPSHIKRNLRLIWNDNVPLDQYVTVMATQGASRNRQLVGALTGSGSSGTHIKSLTEPERERLGMLIGTYARTDGNYLAHE